MTGLTRIVLYRRERPAIVEPYENGLLLTTLRYGTSVREEDSVFEGLGKVGFDPDMVEMAETMIERKTMTFDPSTFDDRYEDALLAMIRKKRKGRKAEIAKPAEPPSNVVNLFDALKKSLASEKKEGDGKLQKPASGGNSSPAKPIGRKSGKPRESA